MMLLDISSPSAVETYFSMSSTGYLPGAVPSGTLNVSVIMISPSSATVEAPVAFAHANSAVSSFLISVLP